MKQNSNFTALLSFFFALFLAFSTQAQNAAPAAFHQKDFIGDNPTADRDLKTVNDFINDWVAGDLDKARGMLASTYMLYGPGAMDSADAEKAINKTREDYKTQLDRSVNFVSQTFRVLSGDLQGNWVSVWATYTCTVGGKKIRVPMQGTFHVLDDGKIDREIDYYDMLSVITALGYKVTPPAPSKGKKK